MLCYKDKTFCSSLIHKDCDREITPEEIKHAEEVGLPIAYANFCVETEKYEENELAN